MVLVATLVGGLVAASELLRLGAAGTSPRPLTLAVVGDSYSAGRNNQVVWPTLLAQRTGWAVANFALPNAGFAADGQGAQAFSYQIERAAQVYPQAIVIMSGAADAEEADTGAVADGVKDAIDRVKLGGELGLIVGPTWYEEPVPEAIRTTSDEIHKAADDAQVPFLSALDPPWLTVDQMQADLRGVTDDGQSVIADKVAAWLRAEVKA